MNEIAFLLGSVFAVGYYFLVVRKERAKIKREAALGGQAGNNTSFSSQGGDK